jgi:UDP-GlcNAc3NAcA epimerase
LILLFFHRLKRKIDTKKLLKIMNALNEIHATITPVILPLHPRTKNTVDQVGLDLDVHVIPPVGYLEMLWLLKHCCLILTDSGGVQKEAFFFAKPCVTTRDQTEWVELVEAGVNCLVGADKKRIKDGVMRMLGQEVRDRDQLYGGGRAADIIVDNLCQGHMG